MKIVKLAAENVKRLRAVEVKPNGDPLVVVGGRNAQGKSSVLDAIMYALGGAGSIPAVPVRKGARKAEIELDLGDISVRRTMTADGGGSLVVTGADGAKRQSPQKLLDALYARGAFDPLAFIRSHDKQAATLRALVGLDTAEIDARRKAAYDERTECARRGKALAAQLATYPEPTGDEPTDEVSVAGLAAALSQATSAREQALASRVELHRTVQAREAKAQAAQAHLETCEDAVRRAEVALEQARAALEAALVAGAAAAKASVEAHEAAAAAPETPSTTAEQAALAGAEEHNRRARRAAERREIGRKVEEERAAHRRLTQVIERADEAKAAALAASKMPVPGLAIDDAERVTLDGLPLDQASAAEQMRVSVAVGLAQNPQLRVMLVRDGSLLDDDSLRLLSELAAERDAQVWVERVGAGAECSVVIEDGEVARG